MSKLNETGSLVRRQMAALIVALLPLSAFAQQQPVMSAVQEAELGKLYQSANTVIQQSGDLRQQIEIENAEIAAIRQSLGNLDQDAKNAAGELERLQKIDRDSPGVLRQEVLSDAQSKMEAASKKLKDAKTKLAQSIDEFDGNNKLLARKAVEETHAKADYLSEFDSIANGILVDRINGYKKPQEVTESATVACGNLSISDCKSKSLQEAERKAIERGSVIVVDSLTEINNLTLTKDKARSEVRGTITSRQILESSLVNDDTAAFTNIKATITPGVTDSLRDEILQSVRDDMSAQIGDGGLATKLETEKIAATPAVAVMPETDSNTKAAEGTPLAALYKIYNRRDEQRMVSLNVSSPSLKIGKAINMTLTSTHPGYVYLLMVGSDGNAFDMIFPNKRDSINSIDAGETIRLPRQGWQLVAQGPAGKDYLLVIVSDAPRDFSAIGMKPSGPFSSIGFSDSAATDIQLATGVSANVGSAECQLGVKTRNLAVGARSCSNSYGAALLSVEEFK
jgi:Domain of unknown function (DUF4384)